MNNVTRRALFASAITGATLVVASPAQAACTVSATALTCAANTTTTDTLNAGVSPASDRGYDVTSGATQFSGTVATGVVVDGYGLGIDDLAAAGAGVNFVNNGIIQVNAGNTATINGSGALNIWVDSGNINYSGTGDILNLGPAGSGTWFEHSGTGNIVANFGGSVTGSAGYTGIYVDHNGNGLVDIDTASGETISAGYTGIWVESAATNAGLIDINNRSTISSLAGDTLDRGIVVDNAGTGGIIIANSGAIGSATDRVALGISALSNNASAVSVTGSGAVFASATGIAAQNLGSGTNTVNYTGSVNSSGGTGIFAVSGSGTNSVTTGAGAITASGAFGTAIVALSNTGAINITTGSGAVTGDGAGILAFTLGAAPAAQTIVVNGAVTGINSYGISSQSEGARTITVGTAGVVTGGSEAIQLNAAGGATINNNGMIGSASTGIALLATPAGSVAFNNGSASNSTAVLNGRLVFSGNADTLINRAIWNTQGVTDFGAGVDTFANTGGTINILGNATLANLENFSNTGRINFSAGTTLTGPAVAFVNGPGSFIDTAGSATIAGFTSMSNSGTIDLAAGTFTVPAGVFTNTSLGTIIADEGATTITGQTSFVNAGVIDLLDGAVNDTLTINSAYSGTGRLQIDVSGTTADLLVINGNVTGQTMVDVNTVGLGVFDPDGIQFVDVTGAFTSAPGSFVIGEEVSNPLINFDVERRGQDFFLVTLLDADNAFVPLSATGLVREMWYQSADEVFANTLAPSDRVGLSLWGNVYGGERQTGMSDSQTVNGVQYDADNNIEIDRLGVQAGVGYGFGLARIGLTGGYEQAAGEGDGEFDASGFNIGLYGQYGGLTGFHAEALFKHDSYDVEFDGLFDGNDVDGDSTGFDIAGGYRFAVGIVPWLDVHAGLSHVWSNLDDVSAYGFGYEFDKLTSTRGRLGVRGNFGGVYNPYLGGTIYREFDGDGDVTISQGAFSSDLSSTGKGTWARLEGGIGGTSGTYGLNLAGWVDVGDTRGVGIRAGFRF